MEQSPPLTDVISQNGTDASSTQSAVRMLSLAGVLFGFSRSGGTPLIAGSEIEWLTPQSEYRPTEYVQSWLCFWFNEQKRLKGAKYFQYQRIEYLKKIWKKDKDLNMEGFDINHSYLKKPLDKFAANQTKYKDFKRKHDSIDLANAFLNHDLD